MKHIKKALSYSMVGSLGLVVVAGLQGCGEQAAQQPTEKEEIGNLKGDLEQENFFLVIEQTGENPDQYMLAEKYPTEGNTRAILKGMDGTEKVLSNEELTALAEAEAAKVEAGTSELTQEPTANMGGMGLGETILAAAAGSLIGGMLANKLSQNSNFQRRQQANTRPGAAISRPASRTPSKPTATAKPKSKPRSGFGSTGSSRSFGG